MGVAIPRVNELVVNKGPSVSGRDLTIDNREICR